MSLNGMYRTVFGTVVQEAICSPSITNANTFNFDEYATNIVKYLLSESFTIIC